jgi:3-carboxy-cis,cis-muconate cycloisomerase
MRAWDEELPLGELLAGDPEVTAVMPAENVAELLDPAWYTRHVPELMQRVAAL